MREHGVEDATRRTRLANERTYLAWWRTGLTALAVCVGVGKLVPSVSHHASAWAYEGIGACFGVLGVVFLVVAHVRTRAIEKALDRGEFAPMGSRLSFVLVASGALLGLALIAVVLFGR
jgi:putative membrane protein